MKFLPIFFSLFIMSGLKAQTITQVSVYFKTDKFALSDADLTALDTVKNRIEPSVLDSILLFGNTDDRGSDAYNLQLSQRRAASITELLKLKYPNVKINFVANGENKPFVENSNDDNRRKNRRVDVFFYFKNIKKTNRNELENDIKIDVSNNKPSRVSDKPLVPKPLPTLDTLVEVGQGVVVEMTKEDARKGCLTVKPIITVAQVQASGMRTVTEDGSPLISGGMFDIETCDGKCLSKPLRILVPFNSCTGGYDFYRTSNGGASWTRSTNPNEKIKKIRIDGADFLEFTVVCPGKINCDVPPCECKRLKRLQESKSSKKLKNLTETKKKKICRECYGRIRLVTPKGMKIDSLFFTQECPLINYEAGLIRHHRRALVPFSMEYDYLNAVATDKDGTHYKLKPKRLKELKIKKRLWGYNFMRNTDGGSIFKRRRFRKIIFKQEDFEQL